MVGVLVLVDQHVPEPAPVDLPHVGELLEQVDGEHDQVVEVECVGLPQPLLVQLVRRRVGLLELVLHVAGGVVLVAQLVLVVGDPVQQRAGLEPLRVEVELLGDVGHQSLLVGRVVDRERRLVGDSPEVQRGDLLAQDADAGGVERRDPHDPGPPADQLLDPVLHLGRGLVGEGDGQDRSGVRLALADQPGDPTGQHPGLAGARARDDEQRAALVDDRGALGLVEPLEQLLVGRSAETASRQARRGARSRAGTLQSGGSSA